MIRYGHLINYVTCHLEEGLCSPEYGHGGGVVSREGTLGVIEQTEDPLLAVGHLPPSGRHRHLEVRLLLRKLCLPGGAEGDGVNSIRKAQASAGTRKAGA